MERWWLLAPGALYMIVGGLFLILPPASPRSWYGYHCRLRERDRESWDDTNRFAGWGMLLLGFLSANTAITCMVVHLGPVKAWCLVGMATAVLSFACVIATKAWLQAREEDRTDPPDERGS